MLSFSGKNMSTKAVGCNERFDVTDEYKFKEGSALERVSVTNAVSRSRHREISARKSGQNFYFLFFVHVYKEVSRKY